MSGREPTGNSTSTTGPVTRAIRPVAVAPASAVPSTVAVTFLLTSGAGTSERVGAADNLTDLVGDLGLTRLVGQTGQVLGEFLGVVRGGLHRGPPGRLLGGGRLQEGEVDPVDHVLRQQLVQDLLRRGLELVQRKSLAAVCLLQFLLADLFDLQRQ